MTDLSPLCKVCSRLNVELLRDNDVEYHPDLASLKLSADTNCPICLLFWTALVSNSHASTFSRRLQGVFDSGQSVARDMQLWLRGEFHDLGDWSTTESQGSHISVSCGRLPGWANDEEAQTQPGLSSRVGVWAEEGA